MIMMILIGNNNIDVGNYQILLDAIVNSKAIKNIKATWLIEKLILELT